MPNIIEEVNRAQFAVMGGFGAFVARLGTSVGMVIGFP
jgi:hypothetical protein